jgi:hypothetical protein
MRSVKTCNYMQLQHTLDAAKCKEKAKMTVEDLPGHSLLPIGVLRATMQAAGCEQHHYVVLSALRNSVTSA